MAVLAEPTFVLVPGMASTAAVWSPVVGALAERGARACPVELPGHGFDTRFPDGFAGSQDQDLLAGAPSPIADRTLDDYTDHVRAIVEKVAAHGPVVLVGHSLGGNVVTRVANAVPGELAMLVYVCAYCCVDAPTVLSYAPRDPDPDSPLARARRLAWIGDPASTGASRTNPRTADREVIDAQHALLMADLDREKVPAALAYALQPDESVQALAGAAQANPATWGTVPRAYLRTRRDEVIPLDVQDRMIAEADAATPENPFAVRDLDTSHLVPLTRPGKLADHLVALART
ncbi:alpha/beta hydrolase [Saccharopolyspora indica]|uniref:alpha/beta fold hydrolase n=1 Tax=Saccharopolyspora indica TaxID=1229659 RepID=UPI0022EAA3CA|nr:alpha/beta fold hydrolase [Saccharopolyspora indica]MDA3646562.1 alpha/beta fold hydrolase [Saccharopolyspora indica]